MQSNILTKAIACVALAAMFSCAPKKRLAVGEGSERRMSRTESRHVLEAIAQRQSTFATFSGRAKSTVSINNDRYDVTANVRIKRDKAIWISITALMGIEAGRVLITPDSVQIINRLQSGYIRKPFDYIHQFTATALDFSALQQLLVGDVFTQVTTRDGEVWANPGGYQLKLLVEELLYTVQLDTGFHTVRTLLDEAGRHQRMEASYADYRDADGRSFPYQVRISITADRFNLQSAMQYSTVVYDEPVDMPFSIPSRYREIQ
ncbi:DUF4292 domain-containing protein [Parapedobacter sp. DT-150]|uniref:DUF4292 domain-containing protein n=1 Tax=Parapedobacter sp. DT-150 TaxID=3396162 RepID=UPI003F197DD5